MRAGSGDARAMVAAFRDSLVLVPQDGGGAVAMEVGGVQWLPVFTTHAELAAWVVARGGDGNGEQNYLAVQCSRLLDVAIPDLGFPAGIAIDPAGTAPKDLSVFSSSESEVLFAPGSRSELRLKHRHPPHQHARHGLGDQKMAEYEPTPEEREMMKAMQEFAEKQKENPPEPPPRPGKYDYFPGYDDRGNKYPVREATPRQEQDENQED